MSSEDFVNALEKGDNLGAEDAFKKAKEGIYDTLLEIFARSEKDNVTTHDAALRVAKKRIERLWYIRYI